MFLEYQRSWPTFWMPGMLVRTAGLMCLGTTTAFC